MNIFNQDNVLLRDVPITASAEHEEELMKSDFIKLSWSDSEKVVIPVDSYIMPFDDGVRYSLLEPYEPEQKSEVEYHYEPKFQHPKMYLSKVTFKRPSKDSDANDITLLDWAYVGEIYTLLQYFCDQINDTLGLTGHNAFGYEVIGELNQNIATVSFSTQDILSALTNVANMLECEWHLEWSQKTLYFGRVMFLRSGEKPELIVGENISVPSIRNSKEGFWNAFEPQGSTRNMTRRAASGEYVLANVRLSLRGYDDNKYPDGIVYTDGEGHIISKSTFDRIGVSPYIKSLIFEDVYPKLDLYVYNVRYRERFLLEDKDNPESKVIDHYDSNNEPVYKKYAVWYMRLAYPKFDQDGHVTEWKDFDISDVRDLTTTVKEIVNNSLEEHSIQIILNITVNSDYFTHESETYPDKYVVELKAGNVTVRGRVDGNYFSPDGICFFWAEWGNEADIYEPSLEKLTAFQNAISVGATVEFVSGVKRSKFPKVYSQIIDGKSLYGQFKVNTHEDAESSPLAGRGNGDNGNYGFGFIYLGIEGRDYVDAANRTSSEDGDTGIVDMDGNRAEVTEKDYEIVFQQTDDYILPTIKDQMMIPKGSKDGDTYVKNISLLGNKDIGLRGNIVNFYNIVMDSTYEESAQSDLESYTKKYISLSLEDNNSYSFKSDPYSFSEQFHTPLYLGEKVKYIDGKTYTTDNPHDTRVMKLVTKIDYPFEQEITIGNEILKGSQQSLKEQVQTMISYGAASGSGSGEGSGISLAYLRQLLKDAGADLFLSKKYDDVAYGVIGFLKGAWFGAKQWYIDAAGNANFYNTTVNGILKAWNAIINNVRSTNYTGDGMMDSGWRITNEYEGTNSKATFDYLYIRKKAIFEELEIRKLSHIGGNFCLSGASGRVWKVDYFDSNGDLLGYDVHVVPWTLGGRIMTLFTKNPTILNKYLGKKKQIQRRLTDAEKLRVATIRVYMFTDDGSTETMLNWTVGAQARCQQFNVEKQMEFDGSSWTGTKVGNTYWYRLVSAVGEQKMEDGLKHEWIEFRVDPSKEGTAYEWADALSDFPSVGDVFVQMGHRTMAGQSNVIMLETANADSPAIKMYAGVNWWTYDGKEVAVMSPDGWKVSANRFEWTTSYGEKFRQTVDRGAWVNIPVDENNKRRCYFNDVVSHNGCLWRCIVAEGTYTTDEPSDSSTAWIKEVSAGIAPYVSLSEQIVSIPCEKDSTATAAVSKTVVVKLMVSNLEATITGVTLTGADAHVYKSGNNIVISFAAGASVENKNYTVAVTGDLNGNHYEAENTLGVYAAIKGNDGFEISAAPDVFIWNQAEESPYPINIDKSETGNSSTLITVTNDGVAQPFTITNVTASGKNASGQATTVVATYSNVSHRVWVTSIANDTEQGQISVTVRYNGTATKTLVLQFYCNLLGTWKEWVVGDTKTEVAERMRFDICDETGAVIGTSTLANYVKSSSKSTATLSKQTADLAVEDTRLQQELTTTKTNLEHSIEDAETTLNAAIQSSATTLNNKIDSTKTELEGDISSTDSALRTAINTAKTELEGDVNTVSTNLATYEQSNDRAVAALTTRVSNNSTAITNTNTRVDTAEGSIQTINSTVSSQGQSISALNTRVSTAEGNISTVSQEIQTVDGKFSSYSTTQQTSEMISSQVSSATQGMVTTSNFQQTASSFSLVTETTAQGYANTAESNAKNAAQGYADDAESSAKTHANNVGSNIENKLDTTGIKIKGDERRIELIANKVTFTNSSGSVNNKIWIDSTSGTLHAVDGDFSGSITATEGEIGSFTIQSDGLGDEDIRYGYTRIKPKGHVEIYNKNAGYGLDIWGGARIQGDLNNSASDRSYIEVANSSGNDITIKGDTVNIGNSSKSTAAINMKSDTTFDGAAIFSTACFDGCLITSSGTQTLPTSPKKGQIVFVKGVSGDITINGGGKYIMDETNSNTSLSYNCGRRSVIFLYDGTRWITYFCG